VNTAIKTDVASTEVSTAVSILRSALTALSDGRISELIDAFDDHFTFVDEALELPFTDKERLDEFFRKERELFPDTVLEVLSTFESGEYVVAEWKVTASQTMPLGSLQLRLPVSFKGTSVVRIETERITSWSDYYDQSTSRRFRLGAFFTEWVEY